MLEVRGVAKSFGGQAVLRGVDLALERERTLAVLGRSGCGKTTLLKILAGLLPPDAGEVRLAGQDVTRLPPERRSVLYLYQEPLLFPHLDVAGNVAFGLRLRRPRLPEAEVARAVAAMLDELELAPEGRKMPHQLSGGQRQRAAFGRALIVNPALLLLDEPFSCLDGETRTAMQQLFQRVAAAHSITAVFVTHSLKEAILMGDSLAHLEGGSLRTYASKGEFLRDPASGVQDEVRFWAALGDGHRHF
ncbi:MAG TPA: ABC transporter ATP-binding protein [Thermoanaerobaculia bacterium]